MEGTQVGIIITAEDRNILKPPIIHITLVDNNKTPQRLKHPMPVHLSEDPVPVFVKVAIILWVDQTNYKECDWKTDDYLKIGYTTFSAIDLVLASRSWFPVIIDEWA